MSDKRVEPVGCATRRGLDRLSVYGDNTTLYPATTYQEGDVYLYTADQIRQAVEEVRTEHATTDDDPNKLCDCPDCESVQMALDALLARFGMEER